MDVVRRQHPGTAEHSSLNERLTIARDYFVRDELKLSPNHVADGARHDHHNIHGHIPYRTWKFKNIVLDPPPIRD